MSIFDFCFDKWQNKSVTSWWRAPEIFINWERYDEKIDIWSVGCIMAELILLKALFPGKDHLDQLNKIFDIIGTPKLDELHEICTAGSYIGKHITFEVEYNPCNTNT